MERPTLLLPTLLDRLIARSRIKKGDLAKQVDVSSSYVSQVLAGATVPSDDRLMQFAKALGVNGEVELQRLLLRAAYDRNRSAESPVEVCHAFLSLIDEVDAKSADAATSGLNPTLENFPRAFSPMVIVTGDKREDPPKTAGDVGAVSASPVDDRYLRRIPLPEGTEKISDKVFVLADEEYLREKFGHTHLFVIGSPASNHLARIINAAAVFKFAFARETVNEIEEIIANGKKQMDEHGLSGLKIARDEKLADLKFILHEFKQGGIFDPLQKSRNLRARSLRDGVDFATITLAKHPYNDSNEFLAIMAAGFHLPGTIHAVGLLSKPSNFSSHPVGGVVEIKMSEAAWFERIEKAEVQWDTQDYTMREMMHAFESVGKNLDSWPLSKDEAKKLVDLVSRLTAV